MKKLLLFLTLGLAAFSSTQAAIPVSTTPQPITFDERPAATEWSTRSVTGADNTFGSAGQILAGVQSNAAANVTAQVNDASPNVPTANALAAWSSVSNALFTRPTGNGATLLMATLQNTSGEAATTLQIIYSLGQTGTSPTEQVPEHQVFYSLTGESNSWINIGPLSGGGIGLKSNTVALASSWAPNAPLYVVWADDNATGGGDRGYVIDNVSFVAGSAALPLSVSLTAPGNNSVFLTPTNIVISATTGGTVPPVAVRFYTNGVLFASDATSPYSVTLNNPATGTYTVYAEAVNGVETAYSATNTFRVRPLFFPYAGGTYTQSFDEMGPTGTDTPLGWNVGTSPATIGIDVVPNDGSQGASGSVSGWNFGAAEDGDRALGTTPTGNDRHMIFRLQNNTSSNIVGFTLTYDGEVWRNYTNDVGGWLTNFYSTDNGATWQASGFDFQQPIAPAEPQGAVNGNDPANRTADIGGTLITLPTPVSPGGVLYLRWFDFNDSGVTDGGLAIDNLRFAAQFQQFQPFVSITTPTNNQSFPAGANVTISATAATANSVTNVAFFVNGTLAGNDTNAPYSIVVSNLAPGTYNLTATASDSSGAQVSTTNAVSITVSENQLPTVTFVTPTSGDSFAVGANITNNVTLADPDGTVARVEFYVNNVLWYGKTPATNRFEWSSALAGNHTITAVAIDNLGGRTSNSVNITVTPPAGATFLVTNGSSWMYLDDGTDQGTAWIANGFNDSGWSNGLAEFGFGDSAQDRPERTVVRRTANGDTNVTIYFRKPFFVGSAPSLPTMRLGVLRDDGAVVYLNGVEVFRTGGFSNEVGSPIVYSTLTTNATPDDGTLFYYTNLPTTLLNIGTTNVLAVEVHQDSKNSSDVSFDLMLYVGGEPATGPRLSITRISATQAEISWPASATGFTLQYKDDLNAPTWTNDTSPVNQSGGFNRVIVNTTGSMRFWRLAQ